MQNNNELFTAIAKHHLSIETLETRNSDRLDFHDCSVWGVRAALEAAFEAGRRKAMAPKAKRKHPADSTCYIGAIEANHHDLAETFGPPAKGDGYKTEAEWVIILPNKQVATIYNYKNSRSYSPDCPEIEKVTNWHIGGHKRDALDPLLALIGDKAKIVERLN